MNEPHDSAPEELVTLTFTRSELVLLAHTLTITAAMQDTLGGDARPLLMLWERVCEGVESCPV